MDQITYEDLNIVYEDNHILVVVKPQNIGVCPDETKDANLLDLLKDYLVKKYDKPGEAYLGLVHRLDRPTGGVMVFAKTSKAAARLQENMKTGAFEKRYYAITVGKLRERRGILKNMLLKDPQKNQVYAVPYTTEGAKLAVLEYRTVQEIGGYSLVDVNLITGRTHQARVQLATQNAPIFGDQKYGQGKTPVGYHLALWAYELRFPHPTTKEIMVFKVLPPTEEIPWKQFEKAIQLSVYN